MMKSKALPCLSVCVKCKLKEFRERYAENSMNTKSKCLFFSASCSCKPAPLLSLCNLLSSQISGLNQMERSENNYKNLYIFIYNPYACVSTELLVPVGSTFLYEFVEQLWTQVYTDEPQ